MTAKELYDAILVELNKNFGTPDLLLEDFNHFINKGIMQWVQKRYNVYDTNQQTTDDVQVLIGTQIIEAPLDYDIVDATKLSVIRKGKNWFFTGNLDASYFHMLNCMLEYTLTVDYKCYTANSTFILPAKKITAEQEAIVIQNAWLKPIYKTPYYKVVSGGWAAPVVGEQPVTPGSRVSVTYGSDAAIPRTLNPITGIFKLSKVHCEYVKYPQSIVLTYDQVDAIADTSQVMEFKEDVCQEIIKETVKLIALNTGNPILQSYDAVNISVPPQGGQQQQPQK